MFFLNRIIFFFTLKFKIFNVKDKEKINNRVLFLVIYILLYYISFIYGKFYKLQVKKYINIY